MFEYVTEFESQIAEFFGAPYAVATDSCTHALELCLRHTRQDHITIPTRTYISVPMTCMKLGLNWNWKEEEWSDYYHLGNTTIVDAAVLWGKNTYCKTKRIMIHLKKCLMMVVISVVHGPNKT